MKLFIKKINPKAIVPVRHGAMYDLAIPETITIVPGAHVIIGLGFALSFRDEQQDHETRYALIFPRSSTFGKWGLLLANSVGVVDQEYCGNDDEWKLSLFRPSDRSAAPVTIPAGTRLAQFTLYNATGLYPEFEEVDSLTAPNRGGFGSTGD